MTSIKRTKLAVASLALVAATVTSCSGAVETLTGDAGLADAHARHDATGASDSRSGVESGSRDTSPGADTGNDASSCGTCMSGFLCCGGACVNSKNDIDNCGHCGQKCTGPNPYCGEGTCGTPPCVGTACDNGESCCGTSCCTSGQLCCLLFGPVDLEYPACTAPVNGTCPGGCSDCVCASPDTPIATANGARPIADLVAGDLVYSVDHDALDLVPILRVNRTPVHDHHVVRVVLAGGAVLEVSPGHPTADGRTFGDLRAGEFLDQQTIESVALIPYTHAFTYDILPASDTGTYVAGGALIGSTLREPARESRQPGR
jgi:hypothetical protein